MSTKELSSRSGAAGQIIVAVYPDEDKAFKVVKRLVEKDFPMDLISVLGRIHGVGDDSLGIYNVNATERIQAWGAKGAFWGGLWGILAGAAGLFVIPGVGAVAAAGYVVEAIAAATLLGAGTMAGAAALSQLAIALRRTGIPEEKILSLHKSIEEGKYIVMLRRAKSDVAPWRDVLASGNPLEIHELPHSRLTSA